MNTELKEFVVMNTEERGMRIEILHSLVPHSRTIQLFETLEHPTLRKVFLVHCIRESNLKIT